MGFVGIEMDLKFCQVLLHRSSAHNKSNRNMSINNKDEGKNNI